MYPGSSGLGGAGGGDGNAELSELWDMFATRRPAKTQNVTSIKTMMCHVLQFRVFDVCDVVVGPGNQPPDVVATCTGLYT